MNDSLFSTGIRPIVDQFLLDEAAKVRDYGDYWSASSAGYCMRKLIFERLGVAEINPQARKQRIFTAGHIFHDWMQKLTRDAGVSIAQEIELQDEGLMVRGHFDDLVYVEPNANYSENRLILYDYKTQNSKAFTYQKSRPSEMSHFHRLQLGTYMYMLRNGGGATVFDGVKQAPNSIMELTEARILKISKDDLRMSEQQLLWTPELEADVLAFWNELNHWWVARKIPPCTCADHENGFMAKEAYNPFFYGGNPCSLEWYELCKAEGKLTKKGENDGI